jgi:hypothetical protein
MTEPGSAGRALPTEGAAWIDDPEVPAADAQEQHRDLVDDLEDTDPEAVVGRGRATLDEPPLEVSEGDLADQRVEVPLDDDLDRE